MAFKNQKFTLKTYGAKLYTWSPLPTDRPNVNKTNQKPFYCSAVPGSQGQDWISTYCYDLKVVNSQQEHSAYVECDYVE